MGEIVKVDSASHWYFPDGKSCHKVEMKTKPGEFRNTNLTDARKLGLKPSVTNIIGYKDKPFLKAWWGDQLILAAVTLPNSIRDTLTDEEYAQRILKDAGEQVEVARNFGSSVHDCIEQFIISGKEPDNPELKPYFDHFVKWWEEEIEEVYLSEKTVVGEHYAGRLDLKAKFKSYGVCVADFKTRKRSKLTAAAVKRGEQHGKFAHYKEDGIQLTAYKDADALMTWTADPLDKSPATEGLLSVFIDSQNPTPIEVYQWSEEDEMYAREEFRGMCIAWCATSKYDPSKGVE